jgi:uncharacterized protein (TIGR02996 family)
LSDELFQEVLAHPHSDDPRRVYADWLSERGDPRGEFIAVQCELARFFDPRLAERERELLAEHGQAWVAELGLRKRERVVPGEPLPVVFHRGFPDQICVDIDQLATVRYAQMPLRHVVVSGLRDENVAKLVDVPALAGITAFGLRDARLSPRALARLGDAPLVRAAEHLGFHRGRFNDASNLASIELPALRSLHVDDLHVRNLGVLGRARWLAQIRVLRIRDTEHLPIVSWLQSHSWKLTDLTIETSIFDTELAPLATARTTKTLERLELSIGHGDRVTIAAFATTDDLVKLERFVVTGKALDSELEKLRVRWGEKLIVRRV